MSRLPLTSSKVYVIGGNSSIERIFQQEGATIVSNLSDSTIVVWQGGADVSPELYGEIQHPTTHCDPKRDRWEAACFARANNRIKVGICRGGQFLNVMNGGSLWQDVDNHAITGEHKMVYKSVTGGAEIYDVTSTHHQMFIPDLKNAEIWGHTGLTTRKTAGRRGSGGAWIEFRLAPGHSQDCEICWYPKTRSLCFQPHPEYNSKSTRELFFRCIERALAA